jgi:hypothetical protein
MSSDFNPGRGAREQDRPVPWRFRLGLLLLAPAAWVVQVWAEGHPSAVERFYSRSVYPYIRDLLSTFTSWFAGSLVEYVLIVAVLLFVYRVLRNLRKIARGQRSLRNVAAQFVSGTLALAGLLTAWGILGWGLNYHRRPFSLSAGLDTSPASVEELRLLSEHLAIEAAVLRNEVDEDLNGVMRPFDSPQEALSRAPLGFARADGEYAELLEGSVTRAKAIRLPVLPWLKISGVFSMYTAEPNVAMEPPAADVLASACHEIAHQLGWAREEEAEFVGYIACRNHPDADFRYATTQSALSRTLRALGRLDRESMTQVYSGIEPAVLRDWDAQNRFWRRYDTRIAEVSTRVNDAYLKSQGQQAGVESYGMMVELLVGDYRRQSFDSADPETDE